MNLVSFRELLNLLSFCFLSLQDGISPPFILSYALINFLLSWNYYLGGNCYTTGLGTGVSPFSIASRDILAKYLM